MDTVSTVISILLGILLVVYIILWIIEKVSKKVEKPDNTTIYIDVSSSKVNTFYEESKIVNTTAELVAEFTRCMETITQDKHKTVMFEISNSANGGYVMKTKFGSS